jgi:mono/diheme cytochrome c family protein
VLPHTYDGATQAGVGISIALGAAQLLFAYNLVQTLRGAGAERAAARARREGVPGLRRRWQGLPDAVAEAVMMLIVLGLMTVAAVVGFVIGDAVGGKTTTVTVAGSTSAPTIPTPTTAPTTNATTSTAPSPGGGNAAAGKSVFASAGCGGCHTLKAAGASGTIGPNLDQLKPPLALVLDRVTHGKGAMPAFKGQLSAQQIRDVAAFVVASTSGR